MSMPHPVDTELDLNHSRIRDSSIRSIELFQLDRLAYQTIQGAAAAQDRTACLLKISSSGVNGWGLCALPVREPQFDFIKWTSVFGKLKGTSVADAIHFVHEHHSDWGLERYTAGKASLMDLASQYEGGRFFSRQSEVCNGLERSYLIDHSDRYFSFL
ncbi:hypothetical protein [Paenibacillus sp. OAS669]|uniref:hypothetical protein n=1 Tax=Paenibacillus sp. OAS669 TaxID=2663821 RepID=UPI00178AF95B|nr:hypothetical protein [Paenibacillus sp. OAS669]MBE1443664.1 hypothetical protein [Paenibacillus sp. OAS669]